MLLLSLLLCITPIVSFAGHEKDYEWMGYCCGEKDCIRAVVSIVEFKPLTVIVQVNDKLLVLPNTSVRESIDGHTYWCTIRKEQEPTAENTRCVFYTIGS
mgnify:CR=1 FL=1